MPGVQQNDILHELLALQKDSNEKTSKFDIQLASMAQQTQMLGSRLDKQEELLAKMSDTLNEQKHLSSVVDRLTITISECEKRIAKVEQASAQVALSAWKKISGVALSALVTGACGFFLAKFGLK